MPDRTLRRGRLLDGLNDSRWSVAVLAAPGGFGKTTLMRDWVQELEQTTRVVWFPISPDFSSSDRFWHEVSASARRQGLAVGAAPTLPPADPLDRLEELLQARGPVVLALDEYEHLRDLAPAIDEQLLRLVRVVPGLRVILTSRAATTLTSPASLLRGSILAIGPTDLEFTRDEISAFYEDEPTSSEWIDRVLDETRGYALSVRAMRIARTSPGALDSATPDLWRGLVAEFLKESASDELRSFIASTCVPPYFDHELASELTGRDPDAALRELARVGFGRWIPYSAGHQVFQYVDALREAFREDFRVSAPKRFARAAAVSARWLHANEQHTAALSHALESADFDLATQIVRAVMLTSPESYLTQDLVSQLSTVPQRVFATHPVLAFALGSALRTSLGTRAAAPALLNLVPRAVLRGVGGLDAGSLLFHHVANAVSLRFLRHAAASATAAEAALRYVVDLPPEATEDYPDLRPLSLRHLAYSLYLDGRLDLAYEALDDAIASTRTPWSRNYTAAYAAGLAAVDGRCHQSVSAHRLVDGAAWPRDHEHSYLNALGHVGHAARALDRFEFDRVLAEYEGCEAFLEWSEFWSMINWTLAHARLGLGEAETEMHRLESIMASDAPGAGDNLGTAALLNVMSVSWFALGNPGRAVQLASRPMRCGGQLAPARVMRYLAAGQPERVAERLPALERLRGHTVRSLSAVLTLASAASLQTGSDAQAATLLRRAAALHQAHGPRAHLMYLPGPDLERLRSLAAESGEGALVEYLAPPVATPIDLALADGATEPLTPRERAVLQASVEWSTRRDVARVLHVSPETVKSQLKSIYRKLRVTTREEAIKRALELHLFVDPPR